MVVVFEVPTILLILQVTYHFIWKCETFCTLTEEHVSQQTEEIFLSYAYHITELRREEDGSRFLGNEIEDARQVNG